MNLLQGLTQQVAQRGRELAKAQGTIFRQRLVIRDLQNEIARLKAREEDINKKHREMLAHRESALKLLEQVHASLAGPPQPPFHYTVAHPTQKAIITDIQVPDEDKR